MSPHSVPMLVNCQTSHLSSFKLSWFMWIGDLVFRGLCGVSDLMLSTRTLHSIIMWPTVTLELLPAAAANNYCLWHHSQVVLKVSCHMLLCKQLPPRGYTKWPQLQATSHADFKSHLSIMISINISRLNLGYCPRRRWLVVCLKQTWPNISSAGSWCLVLVLQVKVKQRI